MQRIIKYKDFNIHQNTIYFHGLGSNFELILDESFDADFLVLNKNGKELMVTELNAVTIFNCVKQYLIQAQDKSNK